MLWHERADALTCLHKHRENVAFPKNQERLAVDRDFGAAVLSVQDLVANLDVHRDALVLLEAPRPDGEDLALLRLFFRGIRDIQPAAHLLALFKRADDDSVGQRVDLHCGLGGHTVCSSPVYACCGNGVECMEASTH